jgi:trk system potassium uptake protein
LELPEGSGTGALLIVAVVREEEVIIPKGPDRLLAGDLIYFISEERFCPNSWRTFDKHAQPVKRVLIVGGGRIGIRLAAQLETQSIYCKIIEKNAARCVVLAERLNKAIVLHGDGSDQSLLTRRAYRRHRCGGDPDQR